MIHRRRVLIVLFLAFSLFLSKHPAVEAASEFFPKGGAIFAVLMADPEEVSSGGLFSRSGGLNSVDFFIGNHFRIGRWQFGEASDWIAQWGFSFVVFGRILDFDEMNANDFIVNLPVEFRRGRFSGRVTVGHESAHLGDERLVRTGEDVMEFSREFIQGTVSVKPSKLSRIYAGYTDSLSASSDRNPQELQLGFELRSEGFQVLSEHDCWFYIAHDFQFKKETRWNGNNNSQAGLGVKFSGKDPRIRFFVNYFDGFSNFGQFFSEKEQTLSLGIAFDR